MNLKLSEVTFNLIMLHNATLFNFCFTVTTSLARTVLIKLQTCDTCGIVTVKTFVTN